MHTTKNGYFFLPHNVIVKLKFLTVMQFTDRFCINFINFVEIVLLQIYRHKGKVTNFVLLLHFLDWLT